MRAGAEGATGFDILYGGDIAVSNVVFGSCKMHVARSKTDSPARWRVAFPFVLFLVLGLGLIGRLYVLQVVGYDGYAEAAERTAVIREDLVPQRGEIFLKDKDGAIVPLAINKKLPLVYAIPKKLHEEGEVDDELIDAVAEALSLDRDDVEARLTKEDDPYEPLKKRATEEEIEQLEVLDRDGIAVQYYWDRFYPLNDLGAQTIGFLGFKGAERIGQYGLEGYYHESLQGDRGIFSGALDGIGRLIPFRSQTIEQSTEGDDLVLTIDPNISFAARDVLKQLLEDYEPKSASVLVMNPQTGAILAMESMPSYDPNVYAEVEDQSVYLNPLIHIPYETGSVMKPMTMAMGVDLGVVTPETTMNDVGHIAVADRVIRNADQKSYGEVTMVNVLEKSINTGVVFVQQQVGREKFLEYYERFGFDDVTGVDLASERAGSIRNLYTNREINYATAAFGQGVSVTPLQLLNAINAIANGGKLMRPYVVDAFVSEDEEVRTEPEVIERVLKTDSANRLAAMMLAVVDTGQASRAKVDGYFVAGKTGTAQVPEAGGYSEDRTIHSFVGFGPAFDPKFSIMFKLEEPQGVRFSSQSVAPAFSKLSNFLVDYYQIPPER